MSPARLAAALLAGVVSAAPAGAQQPALEAPFADHALLLDATPLAGHALAVGAYGHILKLGPGLAWAQLPSPVDRQLTAVDFVDDDHGWIVGHDAAILHSADGGASWSLQHHDPSLEQPLFAVHFLDRRRGFAAGAYGLLLRTDDGGASWTPQPLGDDAEPFDYHLNAIVPLGDTLLLLGERGAAFRSRDRGDSWQALDFPYDGSVFGALAVGGRVIAYGLRGHVFTSDDAGDSWRAATDGDTPSLMGGCVTGDGRVVLVGMGGAMRVSADRGASFDTRRHPGGDALAGCVTLPDGLAVFGESGPAPAGLE